MKLKFAKTTVLTKESAWQESATASTAFLELIVQCPAALTAQGTDIVNLMEDAPVNSDTKEMTAPNRISRTATLKTEKSFASKAGKGMTVVKKTVKDARANVKTECAFASLV